ncbi:transposase, partial [Streptomyces sp. NPDC091217]|uniref:transposase n=1 Tax=Streptomyces sp. NPDC091217 TaxID=3365975 RepID=UPI0037F5CA10
RHQDQPAHRLRPARRPALDLDQGPAHRLRLRQLAKIGVELFYLPAYSPELNDIELVWRQAKYEDYPQRTQTTTPDIGKAVDKALTRRRDRIRASARNFTQAA